MRMPRGPRVGVAISNLVSSLISQIRVRRVDLAEKSRGSNGWGVGHPLGVVSENFQVKNAGHFMHFYCEKLGCGQKPGPVGA